MAESQGTPPEESAAPEGDSSRAPPPRALPAVGEEPQAVDAADEERSADRAAEVVFGGEGNAREFARLIARFHASWKRRKHEAAPADWLADEFRRFPELWSGEEEIVATAAELVAEAERANADKESLQAHLRARKSKESWLAERIEKGAAAAGASSVGAYAAEIDTAVKTANDAMRAAIETGSGNVSKNKNLDGFIAEHDHANTYNLDATAKGIPYRAEALGSRVKNSPDIAIRSDDGGGVGPPYQSKYGQDAKATRKMLRKGDYRRQRRLVPSGQEGDVPGSTDRIEAGGARSRPLTKDEAKRRQDRAQQDGEIPQYDWNDVSRIDIAKSIGKQALLAAAIATGFQGVRVLARRVWNWLRGEENPPASADFREFFESSIATAPPVALQTVLGAAATVAARRGWLGGALKTASADGIADAAFVGLENARVLFKLARGELSGEQALDEMGSRTCAAVGGFALRGMGALAGSALGLGKVGSFIGGICGYMAGSRIGEFVWEGGKAIAGTVATVAKEVSEAGRSVVRSLNPLTWFS